MSESAMHVVKPVVVNMSLADTSIVKAARSDIPTSHRGKSVSDLILSRDRKWYVPKIFCMQREMRDARSKSCICGRLSFDLV